MFAGIWSASLLNNWMFVARILRPPIFSKKYFNNFSYFLPATVIVDSNFQKYENDDLEVYATNNIWDYIYQTVRSGKVVSLLDIWIVVARHSIQVGNFF